jgi:tRNA (adenine57-N1/adenine58-N1)-methyltransferase catalytic subunit
MVVIVKTNKEYLVTDLDTDFYTPAGLVKSEWLQCPSQYNFEHGGTVQIYPARTQDILRHTKRGPQVVQAKDTGYIIARTGLTPRSIVVDAGCGGAHQTLMLSSLVQHVYAYEINQKHYEICKENVCAVDNVTLTFGSVEQHDVTGVDLFSLDLPEPWLLFDLCQQNLVQGGYMVVYLPNTVQLQKTLCAMPSSSFELEHVCELLERPWKHEASILRPRTTMVAHSGFLAFMRKR